MKPSSALIGSEGKPFVEDVEIAGHIIDSLLLPKILDLIMAHKGTFEIRRIAVGERRLDPSYALVQVQADTEEQLNRILDAISDHGAVVSSSVRTHPRSFRSSLKSACRSVWTFPANSSRPARSSCSQAGFALHVSMYQYMNLSCC